jgi:hypothetical protein
MLIYKSDDFNKENKKILSRERKSHLHLRFFRDGEKPTFYLDFFGFIWFLILFKIYFGTFSF